MYMTRQELYDHLWSEPARQFARANNLNYQNLLYVARRAKVPKPDAEFVATMRYHPENLGQYKVPKLEGDPSEVVYVKGAQAMNSINELVTSSQNERMQELFQAMEEAGVEELPEQATLKPRNSGKKANNTSDNKTDQDSANSAENAKPTPQTLKAETRLDVDDAPLLDALAEDVRKSLKPQLSEEAKTKKQKQRRTVSSSIKPTDPEDPEASPRWNTLYFLPKPERRRVIKEIQKIHLEEETLHPVANLYQQSVNRWQAVREVFGEEANRDEQYLQPAYVGDIGEDSIPRVVKILNALFLSAQRLDLVVEPDYSITVHGTKVPLDFTEGRKRVPHEAKPGEANPPMWDHQYNGKLTLSIGTLYVLKDRKKKPLEEALGDALELLFTAAFQKPDRRAEAEQVDEDSVQYKEELARTERLLEKAEDYDNALKIRNLIRGVHETMKSGDLEGEDRWPEWAAWASAKADWLDPTVGYRDRILGRKHYPILDPRGEEKLDDIHNSAKV